MWSNGCQPHIPQILLSASAKYQWSADHSQFPKIASITPSDPHALEHKLYCSCCVTPPLGELLTAKWCETLWTKAAGGWLGDQRAQLQSLEVVGRAGVSDFTDLEHASHDPRSLQIALDQLQARQSDLQKQLLFYWIDLQALNQQGALCSETYKALLCDQCKVSETMFKLTQYYGKCRMQNLYILFKFHTGRFHMQAEQAHQKEDWPVIGALLSHQSSADWTPQPPATVPDECAEGLYITDQLWLVLAM